VIYHLSGIDALVLSETLHILETPAGVNGKKGNWIGLESPPVHYRTIYPVYLLFMLDVIFWSWEDLMGL